MPTAYTNRSTLNFDSPEPTVTADANASALFPSQPVYARTPKKNAGGNLPLMVGAPVLAIVAGGLVWMAMGDRPATPTDPQSLQTAAAESEPSPRLEPSLPQATPIPQPTELAANDAAPAPESVSRESVARTLPPRASAPSRAPDRRVASAPAETTAPDASAASSNVSATVPAPPPTVSAPAVAEPPPLVIPAPATPQPSMPEPTTPM